MDNYTIIQQSNASFEETVKRAKNIKDAIKKAIKEDGFELGYITFVERLKNDE